MENNSRSSGIFAIGLIIGFVAGCIWGVVIPHKEEDKLTPEAKANKIKLTR